LSYPPIGKLNHGFLSRFIVHIYQYHTKVLLINTESKICATSNKLVLPVNK